MNRLYILQLLVILLSGICLALTSVSEYTSETSRLEKEFKASPSNESLEKWYHHAKITYEKYPMDIMAISQYAYTHYLSERNPADGIRILLPFMGKIESRPDIAFALWRIFNDGIINAKANHNITLEPETPWGLIMKGCNSPLQDLELMRSYWAMYIPEKYEVPQWLVSKVKASRVDVDETNCLFIWKKILENTSEYYLKKERIKFWLSQNNQQSREQKEALDKTKKTEDSLVLIKKELEVFLQLPNTLDKIEMSFNKIIKYREFLSKYPEFPIYQQLKQSIGEYEAQVINLAYQSYILLNFNQCLKNIQILMEKYHKTDARVLAVEVFCLQNIKTPIDQIIKKIDQLLEVEPKNQRAFMLKRILEAQEEFKHRQ